MNNELENQMVIGEYDDPLGKMKTFRFYISNSFHDDRDYDLCVEKSLWRDKVDE